MYLLFLPSEYVVCGKIMFSVTSVCHSICLFAGGGGGGGSPCDRDLLKLVHLRRHLPDLFKFVHLGTPTLPASRRAVGLRLKGLLVSFIVLY